MISVRPLDADETRAHRDDLCTIMVDCVTGGASIGFMEPFTMADAASFWAGVVEAVGRGDARHLAAFDGDRVVGTVQVVTRMPPNQPHRGDLKKLMVASHARGKGVARQLMAAADETARKAGKTLLVLDTATGSDAESLYPKIGWEKAGIIPDYALFPDGRFCDTTVFYKRL
jgi:GNAT superfamily N-acetyltransferase